MKAPRGNRPCRVLQKKEGFMAPPDIASTLFNHEEFSIIADSNEFLRECELLGFATANIAQLEVFPKNSIVFSFSNEAAKMTFEIAKKQSEKNHFLRDPSI
ncbi:hypothetical protein [Pseudomonas fluorescens]|uniref:hypothetical protein n=1 Tax=Pseudomonas fluorescens TaxID=294 RepID=UPI00218241D6|nr:hypothetical protein [Pseudomonas fluorescens]